jgi:DNA invertase Pin-like site-specific DNA recombinase
MIWKWYQSYRSGSCTSPTPARKHDVLLVWELDRLARSLTQVIVTVEALESRGIGFKSLTDTIDPTSAGGRLSST